jgi:hypothetical protein
MSLQLDNLTIKISDLTQIDILHAWGWLFNDVKELLLISKFGDIFFTGQDNVVYWLATDTGTLTQVANSISEFEHLLKHEDFVDEWFLPTFV